MVPPEFLGAFKQGHRQNVREFIDEELSWQMLERLEKNPNDKEAREVLEYMTRYNNEFYKGVIRKNDPHAIHKCHCTGPKHDKTCHYKGAVDAHNARKRDLMTKERQFMPSIDDAKRESDATVDVDRLNQENTVAAIIDGKDLDKKH